jgi:4-aminobutyrate aminotransferase-like enzyme
MGAVHDFGLGMFVLSAEREDPESRRRLESLYSRGLIPPDKKPFLADLDASAGVYLAVSGGRVALLDAASQIATLGLGFNHAALFGAAQHLSSWIDDVDSAEFQGLRAAYVDLLRRQLGSKCHHVAFVNSGAEAIEVALSTCFERRRVRSADRFLAFVGAFHGRTKLALEGTWSPEKREPFSWAERAAHFIEYPEMHDANPASPVEPTDWVATWSALDDQALARRLSILASANDDLLAREIEILQTVRQVLAAQRHFAVLIEPMQCEGGDRYSSRRFHRGLAALSRRYEVPLIYDEIQTGFHLGRTFFWHRQFELSLNGQPWQPDVVVTAKKAQAGIVLSRFPLSVDLETSPASIARGYIQGSLLDQFSGQIAELESIVGTHLADLARRHESLIARPRGQGMAFAFDFRDPALLKRAIAEQFRFGLIFYPAGDRAARFRLNLAFGNAEIEQLFRQLDALLTELGHGPALPSREACELLDVAPTREFHRRLIATKLRMLGGGAGPGIAEVRTFIQEQLVASGRGGAGIDIHVLDKQTYPRFRERILQIQVEVYEPARQTPGEDFDRVFAAERPLAIVLEREQQIIGMALAGPLGQFQNVRGVSTDPARDDRRAAYMVDVTVTAPFRGGLGRTLKQAIVLLALAQGYRSLHGRNRDRLARGMWTINLSLGAYVTDYLVDAYDDSEPYRDCLYYRCPVIWEAPRLCLSSGVAAPFGLADLTEEFVAARLGSMVNKLTLWNFVDERFAADLVRTAELFPSSLRHIFLASGLSEAVDKIVKVLWLARAPRRRLIAFRGHHFGSTTLLARGLSGIGESVFSAERVDSPKDSGDHEAWSLLRAALGRGDVLGMFVEPLPWKSMSPLEVSILCRVRQYCSEAGVPLVYNDSAGLFFRYSAAAFAPSGIADIAPDAVVAQLGSQVAIAGLSSDLFVAEPLKMISTWDGDAFALAKFAAVAGRAVADTSAFQRLHSDFAAALRGCLPQSTTLGGAWSRGGGWIAGDVAPETRTMLKPLSAGRWRICPAPAAMAEFVRRFG